jgi:hypothetical protein
VKENDTGFAGDPALVPALAKAEALPVPKLSYSNILRQIELNRG